MARNYSQIEDPQLNDKSLIWDESNSDWRLTTFNDLITLFDSGSASTEEALTQYSSPATGFNIEVNQNNKDTHLIITPVVTLAEGTITLPNSVIVRDKQQFICNCTQQITTLTIDGNGAVAVNGGPTSMGADDFFTLKYDSLMNAWNRIG